jgi:hypothetical protein
MRVIQCDRDHYRGRGPAGAQKRLLTRKRQTERDPNAWKTGPETLMR